MTRNLRIGLLTMGSAAALAAPVALAVSCGGDSNREGHFNIEDGTLDVGLELSYAPYNFRVEQVQYDAILAESKMTAGSAQDQATLGITPAEATAYLEMIAPAGDMDFGGGIDVYVANRMAEALSTTGHTITTELHKYEWDALIPSMTTRGEFDAIIAGMTATPEREEQIAFTNSYLNAENVVLSKPRATAPTIADLRASNKPIAVQGGTLQEDIAVSIFTRAKVQAYESAGMVENAITAGNNEFAICEDVRANVAIQLQNGLQISDVEAVHFPDNTSGNNIGLPKNTPETTISQLNTAIAGISATDRTEMLSTAGKLAVYVGQA